MSEPTGEPVCCGPAGPTQNLRSSRRSGGGAPAGSWRKGSEPGSSAEASTASTSQVLNHDQKRLTPGRLTQPVPGDAPYSQPFTEIR